MFRKTQGKCWIYKRATLHLPDRNPIIIDYSNGTESFNCDHVLESRDGFFYTWKLPSDSNEPSKNILIPLNVSREYTSSIVRMGSYPYEDGEIHWEFIYGKFQPYGSYMLGKFIEYLIFILIILILLWYILQNGSISTTKNRFY